MLATLAITWSMLNRLAGAATGALEGDAANTRWSAAAVRTMVVGLLAPEFSRGTLRTGALHQPGRARLLAAKAGAVFALLAPGRRVIGGRNEQQRRPYDDDPAPTTLRR